MQNANIFRQVLLNGGLPPHVVDAAIANFIWESGGQGDINTSNQTGDGGNSWGAGQWNGQRRQNLMAFAQQRGTSWTDPTTQAMFVLQELNGPERTAYQALLNTSTPEEALDVWTNKYERAGTPHMDQRQSLLQRLVGGEAAKNVQQGVTERLQGGSPLLESIRSRLQQGGRQTPFLDAMIANRERRRQAPHPLLERAQQIRQDAGFQTPLLNRILNRPEPAAPVNKQGPPAPIPAPRPAPSQPAPQAGSSYPGAMAEQAFVPGQQRPQTPYIPPAALQQLLAPFISNPTQPTAMNQPGPQLPAPVANSPYASSQPKSRGLFANEMYYTGGGF